jgi:hypothetical protein
VLAPSLQKAEKEGADSFIASGHNEADFDMRTVDGLWSAPTVTRPEDDFKLEWTSQKIVATLRSVRERSDGVSAEMAVDVDGRQLYWGRLNLSLADKRAAVVKALKAKHKAVDWDSLIDSACGLVVDEVRRTEPAARLVAQRHEDAAFLIEPFLVRNEINVLFADGGSGKSYLALLLAIAAAYGITLPGGYGTTRKVKTLYLDYETNRPSMERRLYQILAGQGLEDQGGIFYLPMDRPLVDAIPALRAAIRDKDVGLLVIDSFALACGADPEGTEAAVSGMRALRKLGRDVTVLVLAHVSKAMADKGGPGRPFGSVFVSNIARSAWEIRRTNDDSELIVSLHHRKVNDGRLNPPIHFRLTFGPAGLRVDVPVAIELPEHSSSTAAERIALALTDEPQTVAVLAQTAGTSENTARQILGRFLAAGKAMKVISGNRVLWRRP